MQSSLPGKVQNVTEKKFSDNWRRPIALRKSANPEPVQVRSSLQDIELEDLRRWYSDDISVKTVSGDGSIILTYPNGLRLKG